MKQVSIVENKRKFAETLTMLVKETAKEIRVITAYNVGEAYEKAMKNEIDLMLVDIVMNSKIPGDVSGMKFARNIRSVKKYQFVPIIFISALEDPKFYAYSEIHCYSYIEKPIDVIQTKKIIQEALEYKREIISPQKYIYRKDGIFYAVNPDEILYIQNEKRIVTVCTLQDKFTIPYISFAKLLNEVGSRDLIQCSRYYVINKQYVERADTVNRYIKLKNVPEQIEIGVSRKKKFLEEFLEK